jgi:FtsZ-binding cell division protein ZapB
VLEKLYKVIADVFTPNRDVRDLVEDDRNLQREVEPLTDRVTVLAFEIQRLKDARESDQQAAAQERENLRLRLENALLRSGRTLPPTSGTSDFGAGDNQDL